MVDICYAHFMRPNRLPIPKREQAESSGASASGGAAVENKFSEWAAGYAENLESQQAVSSTPHMTVVSGDFTEHEMELAFQELRRKRLELASADPVEIRDFSYRVRGGAWTAKKKKKAYDVGQAKSADVKKWCNAEGLPKSASFDIALYGEAEAGKLATE